MVKTLNPRLKQYLDNTIIFCTDVLDHEFDELFSPVLSDCLDSEMPTTIYLQFIV